MIVDKLRNLTYYIIYKYYILYIRYRHALQEIKFKSVKCISLLHVSLLLGSFSSSTLCFARLALIRCCHLCYLRYFTEIIKETIPYST